MLRKITLSCFLVLSSLAHGSWFDGATLAGGQDFHSKAHLTSYRASLVKNWNTQWFKEGDWHITGYFDLSVNHWKNRLSDTPHTSAKGKTKISALAFSPVFRFTRNTPWFGTLTPFAEVGVGLAWLSGSTFRAKNDDPVDMGIRLQFEDRIGIGFQFGEHQQYSVMLRAFHYSNANFHKENDGFNLQEVGFGWLF